MQATTLVGRRKTSVARIRFSSGKGLITVNGRSLEEYFPSEILRIKINQPLVLTESTGKFDVAVNVQGGGLTGQAEAIRMAISRALNGESAEMRAPLKKEGFLTRDSRMVERKKYGKKKARKRFQWTKR